ncbi:MAG: ABC transporter substrate-binding protein [Deltaproteobacteria bacterium]|nr:ABC transporter substrate-binding protein [Deltaproteobacteria bacterium]
MKMLLKHLWLAVALILGASAILLLSDLDKRNPCARDMALRTQEKSAQPAKAKPHRTVALSYFVPAEVFEQTIAGVRDGLAEAGYREGQNLTLVTGHANGDMGMLSQVTQSLAGRRPDLFIPLSTPCLGNALNLVKETPIVFGLVSSPLQVKAGTTYAEHLPQVTGAVFTLPTREVFAWGRALFPKAVRIGTLYNPSEANSLDEVDKLRSFFPELGFELVAATVTNSNEIQQAAQLLVQKGIDLFFAMGDNTCVNGLSAILKICREHGIPVLADDGSLMGSGALLSCGPSPYQEGRHTARLAVRVLEGENPAAMPFEPSADTSLQVDFAAARRLGVTIPLAMKKRLAHVHHLSGLKGRPARVAVVNLVENPVLDAAIDGFKKGLEAHGLAAETDFHLDYLSAQGELALLPQIFDAALQARPDVLVSFTTPALVTGAGRVHGTPYVFCVASDPAKIGLFKQGRPANITGVHDNPDLDRLVAMAQAHNPDLRSVGIVFDPSQQQSQLAVSTLRRVGKERGVQVLEATAASAADLPLATRSLVDRGASALILSTDNLVNTGFSAVHAVAAGHGIPIFVTDMQLIAQGADGGIGDDYGDWGRQAAAMVVKILTGVPVAEIPLEATRNATLVVPAPRDALAGNRPGRKLPEVRLVKYNQTPFAEECSQGLLDGLARGGMKEGRDFNLRILNAQGDMSTLSDIMTSVKADRVDLLMVVATPTLQAALRQAGADTRIVFTGVGDAVRAGAGTSETAHLPQVTGITTRSPFDKMARLIRETLPGVKAVGTLFTPAEVNSEIYRELFEKALQGYGIELVAVPVTSSSDLVQAAATLCRKEIQAVAQVSDNTTRPGFAQIAHQARSSNLPVYAFESSQMRHGAVLCLASDYYEAGVEAGEKALAVLRGADPGQIPFSNVRSQKLMVDVKRAQMYGLILSPELRARGVQP